MLVRSKYLVWFGGYRDVVSLIIGRDEKACVLSMQLVRSVSDSKIRNVYFIDMDEVPRLDEIGKSVVYLGFNS